MKRIKRGEIMRLMKEILIILALTVMVASLVSAAPTGGTLVNGTTSHGSNSVSTTRTIHGGNVSEVNVSGSQMTTRWGGFFGSLSGSLQLSDATANKFYEWTVSNFTNAVVYAANASVSNWNLVAMNSSTAPLFITSAGSDSYANTFTATEAFSSASIASIAATPYTTTLGAGALKTYALTTLDETVKIWAGKAKNDVASFQGGVVDYQLLVPAAAAGTTYNFYLELP
jgi:hypothetical protein